MSPDELFRSNLALIERAIARVARRAGLVGADADDFASDARLLLIDDDYAVLKRFEGRASLATFVTVVVSNFLHDQRMHLLGRWRPSAEAQRLGQEAVQLETLLVRDRRSIDEAAAFLPRMTRAELEALAARLPARTPRARAVALAPAVAAVAVSRERTDERVAESERERVASAASEVVRHVLASMTVEDRMLVRLRFAFAMSIADVARILRIPQRPLYRRLERSLDALRGALMNAGVDHATAEDLIGSPLDQLDFGFDHAESGVPVSVWKEEQPR